ncbi:MAG: hypothetical protein AMXMBFR59_06840 [Rhodanobacteraceae bacterium]
MNAPDQVAAGAEEARTPDGRLVLLRREAIHVTASGMVDDTNAARYLGTSVRTLQRRRAQGCGPRYRVSNGRVWYPLAALDEYLADCEVNPLAD